MIPAIREFVRIVPGLVNPVRGTIHDSSYKMGSVCFMYAVLVAIPGHEGTAAAIGDMGTILKYADQIIYFRFQRMEIINFKLVRNFFCRKKRFFRRKKHSWFLGHNLVKTQWILFIQR